MTQEEKNLLLKDLCARLPYGVTVEIKGSYDDGERYIRISELDITMLGYMYDDKSSIIPYLRPMSSMAEEEINEFILISDTVLWLGDKRSTSILSLEQMDWLNSHHFDYRGLIEKGLALEAHEGMYGKI